MTQYYIAYITKSNAKLKLKFRVSKLRGFEILTGKLTVEQWQKIGSILPPTVVEINDFKAKLKGVVEFTEIVKEKSLYSQFTDTWFEFYETFLGVEPKFTAVDGMHLKQIINYLKQQTATEPEALELWQSILNNWNNLDEFHKKNTDLKYINSNFNKIVNNVKRGSKGKLQYSDDFKRKISQRLQS